MTGQEIRQISADVLVVGGGAAGIYAALEAQKAGARVCLLDKSMVGVGGATVMAQMTVAAALGHQEDDSATLHYEDTIASGKGLVNEPLAELLCEDAPRLEPLPACVAEPAYLLALPSASGVSLMPVDADYYRLLDQFSAGPRPLGEAARAAVALGVPREDVDGMVASLLEEGVLRGV